VDQIGLAILGVALIWAIVLIGYAWEKYRANEVAKMCDTCIYNVSGFCFYCAGENFGHCAEVSGRGVCKHWSDGIEGRL
jgi:hypothetical protein